MTVQVILTVIKVNTFASKRIKIIEIYAKDLGSESLERRKLEQL